MEFLDWCTSRSDDAGSRCHTPSRRSAHSDDRPYGRCRRRRGSWSRTGISRGPKFFLQSESWRRASPCDKQDIGRIGGWRGTADRQWQNIGNTPLVRRTTPDRPHTSKSPGLPGGAFLACESASPISLGRLCRESQKEHRWKKKHLPSSTTKATHLGGFEGWRERQWKWQKWSVHQVLYSLSANQRWPRCLVIMRANQSWGNRPIRELQISMKEFYSIILYLCFSPMYKGGETLL